MTRPADFVLLIVLAIDLYLVVASRLTGCVRASAAQGIALAALPVAIWGVGLDADGMHILVLATGTVLVKGLLIPWLLLRAIRQVSVRREVDPFVSQHGSLLIAAGLVALSFWLATELELPIPAPTKLLVPVAFSTVLIGFLVISSRRKAITQVVGYLVLENGIFVFGLLLVREMPFTVELGILLDLLVGVFVMGIAIHHIHREFDHIDTELLSSLKDSP